MSLSHEGPLATYNSLLDPHLERYFSRTNMKRHLKRSKLITLKGEVIPESKYRLINAGAEYRRKVRKLLAQAIVTKALDVERRKLAQARKHLEYIAKMELVKKAERKHTLLPKIPESYQLCSSPRSKIKRSKGHGSNQPRRDKTKTVESHEGHGSRVGGGTVPLAYSKSPKRVSAFTDIFNSRASNGSQTDAKQISLTTSKDNKADRALTRKQSTEGDGETAQTNLNRKPHPPLKRSSSQPSRDESSRPIQTERNTQERREKEVITSCKMTFEYLGDATSPNMQQEIVVEQQYSEGSSPTVFKRYLKPNTTFTFTSKRQHEYPLGLTLYIDGHQSAAVSTCCEYKHRKGALLGSKTSHFKFVKVTGAKPCFKCEVEAELSEKAEDEKKQRDNRKQQQEQRLFETSRQEELQTTNDDYGSDFEADEYEKNVDGDKIDDESYTESQVAASKRRADKYHYNDRNTRRKAKMSVDGHKSQQSQFYPTKLSPSRSTSQTCSPYDLDKTELAPERKVKDELSTEAPVIEHHTDSISNQSPNETGYKKHSLKRSRLSSKSSKLDQSMKSHNSEAQRPTPTISDTTPSRTHSPDQSSTRTPVKHLSRTPVSLSSTNLPNSNVSHDIEESKGTTEKFAEGLPYGNPNSELRRIDDGKESSNSINSNNDGERVQLEHSSGGQDRQENDIISDNMLSSAQNQEWQSDGDDVVEEDKYEDEQFEDIKSVRSEKSVRSNKSSISIVSSASKHSSNSKKSAASVTSYYSNTSAKSKGSVKSDVSVTTKASANSVESVKSNDFIQSPTPAISRDSAKSANSIKSRDSIRSPVSATSRDSMKSSGPAKSRDSVKSAGSVKSRDSIKSSTPAISRDSVKSANSIKSRDSIMSARSIKSTDSIKTSSSKGKKSTDSIDLRTSSASSRSKKSDETVKSDRSAEPYGTLSPEKNMKRNDEGNKGIADEADDVIYVDKSAAQIYDKSEAGHDVHVDDQVDATSGHNSQKPAVDEDALDVKDVIDVNEKMSTPNHRSVEVNVVGSGDNSSHVSATSTEKRPLSSKTETSDAKAADPGSKTVEDEDENLSHGGYYTEAVSKANSVSEENASVPNDKQGGEQDEKVEHENQVLVVGDGDEDDVVDIVDLPSDQTLDRYLSQTDEIRLANLDEDQVSQLIALMKVSSSITTLKLRHVDLSDNMMLSRLAETLIHQHALKVLVLSSCRLTSESCPILAEVIMKHLPSLSLLSLRDNPDIGDRGIADLLRGVLLKSEADYNRRLDLKAKEIVTQSVKDAVGSVSLASIVSEGSAVENQSNEDTRTHVALDTLVLSSCRIGNSSLEKLSQIIKYGVITDMRLAQSSNVTQIGWKVFLNSLHHNSTKLKNLDISYNSLGRHGMITGSPLLALSGLKLESLNLTHNQISSNHVEQLSADLRNSSTRIGVMKLQPGNELTSDDELTLSASCD